MSLTSGRLAVRLRGEVPRGLFPRGLRIVLIIGQASGTVRPTGFLPSTSPGTVKPTPVDDYNSVEL